MSLGHLLSPGRRTAGGQSDAHRHPQPAAQRRSKRCRHGWQALRVDSRVGDQKRPGEQAIGVELVRKAIQPVRRSGNIEFNLPSGGDQTGLYEPTSVLQYFPVDSAGSKESTALAHMCTAPGSIRRGWFARLPCQGERNGPRARLEGKLGLPPVTLGGKRGLPPVTLGGKRGLPPVALEVPGCRVRILAMIRYSVLIPQRNAGSELARQLPELRRVLDMLALPYEVICIDQASAPPTHAALQSVARPARIFAGTDARSHGRAGSRFGRRNCRRPWRAGGGHRAREGISGAANPALDRRTLADRHRFWSSEARRLGACLAKIRGPAAAVAVRPASTQHRLFVLGGPARSGRRTRVGAWHRSLSAVAGGDARVSGGRDARPLSAWTRGPPRRVAPSGRPAGGLVAQAALSTGQGRRAARGRGGGANARSDRRQPLDRWRRVSPGERPTPASVIAREPKHRLGDDRAPRMTAAVRRLGPGPLAHRIRAAVRPPRQTDTDRTTLDRAARA